MSFRRFFLVRLAWALVAVWLAATLVFLLFFVFIRDPERTFAGGERAPPAAVEHARKEFHFDTPLHEQYARYLWRLVVHQSTGSSPYYSYSSTGRGRPIDAGEVARQALPATASLVGAALVLALVVSAAAGISWARFRWRRIANVPIYIALGLLPFVVGLELSYYLGARWGLTPISGYCDFFDPSEGSGCGGARDWLTHLILPAVTLSLYFAAIYTRIIRACVVDVLAAKKVEERRKRRRRFILGLARLMGRDFGYAVGAAVLVEAVFTIPGLGYTALYSVDSYDFALLMAIVLYGTFLAIAVHFLVDVIVGALDADLRAEWPVARALGGT